MTTELFAGLGKTHSVTTATNHKSNHTANICRVCRPMSKRNSLLLLYAEIMVEQSTDVTLDSLLTEGHNNCRPIGLIIIRSIESKIWALTVHRQYAIGSEASYEHSTVTSFHIHKILLISEPTTRIIGECRPIVLLSRSLPHRAGYDKVAVCNMADV